MHMFSREKNFYGGHGIVGAQVPIGTGLAFAHQYKKDGGVCLTYLGDGAVNQGQVAESFNMAALWKLPVIYVIENNKYGMGTSIERAAAGELYKRGEPFGIPGKQIDGMDVLKVHEAAVEALEHARSGKGPVLLEMITYRYRGHSMSDPAKYRTKEEVEEWRSHHDPIDMLRAYMLKEGAATEDSLKDIEREVKEIVADAAEFAQSSPEPDPSELWTDVPENLLTGSQENDYSSADAGAVADHDRRQDCALAQERGRYGQGRARFWLKSKPTRRPWKSKRSMKARSAKSLFRPVRKA